MTTWVMSGSETSAVNFASPFRNSGSSRRLIEAPSPWTAAVSFFCSGCALTSADFGKLCTAVTASCDPPQRPKFPSICRRISDSSGAGLRFSRSVNERIMPGVQKPHWTPWCSQNAVCNSVIEPIGESPSMVTTSDPSACAASIVQLFTDPPSTRMVHAPHWPVSQPTLVPVNPRRSRTRSESRRCGGTETLCTCPFTFTEIGISGVAIFPSSSAAVYFHPDSLDRGEAALGRDFPEVPQRGVRFRVDRHDSPRNVPETIWHQPKNCQELCIRL